MSTAHAKVILRGLSSNQEECKKTLLALDMKESDSEYKLRSAIIVAELAIMKLCEIVEKLLPDLR